MNLELSKLYRKCLLVYKYINDGCEIFSIKKQNKIFYINSKITHNN